MSPANKLIKGQLAEVNMAVNVLASLNLTVTGISIENARPRILIDRGPGCQQLRGVYTKYMHKAGRRITEYCALIGECQIRWEEEAR